MIKIQSTVEPLVRNSEKSDRQLKPIIIEPADIKYGEMPLGEMMKHWTNFDLEHYKRVSLLRATNGEM